MPPLSEAIADLTSGMFTSGDCPMNTESKVVWKLMMRVLPLLRWNLASGLAGTLLPLLRHWAYNFKCTFRKK